MAISQIQVIVNGETVTLDYNESTGKYEKKMKAPAFSTKSTELGFVPVTVEAKDTAGNTTTVTYEDETFGDNLKLYTIEHNLPTVSFNSPSANSYITVSNVPINFTIYDNKVQTTGFSGFNLGQEDYMTIIIDGTAYTAADFGTSSALNPDGSEIVDMANAVITYDDKNDGGYYGSISFKGNFTKLADGEHTVGIKCKDTDGNESTAVERTFTVDTVKPSLEDVKVNGLTDAEIDINTQDIVITGTTNDTTSFPVTVTITVDGVDQGTVDISEDGSFTKSFSLGDDGTYNIIVKSTDLAGQFTSVEYTVNLDTKAPVFKSIVITPDPTDASGDYWIYVEVE